MKDNKFNIGDIIYVYYYKNGKFIYHKSEVREKTITRGVRSRTTQYLKELDNNQSQLNYCPKIDEIGVVLSSTYLRVYLTNKDDELAYKKFEEYYIEDMNKKIEETKRKIEQLKKSREI